MDDRKGEWFLRTNSPAYKSEIDSCRNYCRNYPKKHVVVFWTKTEYENSLKEKKKLTRPVCSLKVPEIID